MTTPNCTVAIEAWSRKQLFARFTNRYKHLTLAKVEQRFDDLLQHGYAHARQGSDGKWRFVLVARKQNGAGRSASRVY